MWHDASRLEMQHTTVGIVKEGDEENKLTNRNADGRQPFVCRCSALCPWSRKGSRKRFQRHRQSSTTAVCYCPSFSFFPSFLPSTSSTTWNLFYLYATWVLRKPPTRVCGFVWSLSNVFLNMCCRCFFSSFFFFFFSSGGCDPAAAPNGHAPWVIVSSKTPHQSL